MNIFLWVLAFIGVALIYVIPPIMARLGKGTSALDTPVKIAGVIIALVCLIILYRIGGFN
ncbi:MAG: hypothetical protein Q8873_04045 [Bacillota bacterium]|nr:hypothetical protein [Bacillota bacterium]